MLPKGAIDRDNDSQYETAKIMFLAKGHSEAQATAKAFDLMRKFGGTLYKRKANSNRSPASPGNSIKLGNSPKAKRELSRATSSPLTEASAVASPSTAPIASVQSLKAPTPESEDSADGHQPPPAPAQPHYQTFGDNPLKFDDPTIYEIRPVTDEMTEEEKKEIYCVASYPHDDLSHLIAGTPPNKDFSNAVKPNNQVQAHTFASYLDGYLRDFKEEDIGFLNERVFCPPIGVCRGILTIPG